MIFKWKKQHTLLCKSLWKIVSTHGAQKKTAREHALQEIMEEPNFPERIIRRGKIEKQNNLCELYYALAKVMISGK